MSNYIKVPFTQNKQGDITFDFGNGITYVVTKATTHKLTELGSTPHQAVHIISNNTGNVRMPIVQYGDMLYQAYQDYCYKNDIS